MRRVFVAGHRGMVGSAICRQLSQQVDVQLLTRDRSTLDLTRQSQVETFFAENKPDEVYLAAAKVGGIVANNTYRADFLYENLAIQNNIVHVAHTANVKKLLFLGSSCIYPKLAPQPITESDLLTGPLEQTNEPYAVAKIAGLKMCEAYNQQYGCDYRSVMPTNLYGPGDNFHPESSHVIPGLMSRFDSAIRNNDSNLTIWGSGQPRREFLHVDDMATACIFVMQMTRNQYNTMLEDTKSHVNVGTGEDCSIRELAEIMKRITGFSGDLEYDVSKPDGSPRKLLNVSKLERAGWRAKISLLQGLRETWNYYSISKDKTLADKEILL